jgi:hypothetical protein
VARCALLPSLSTISAVRCDPADGIANSGGCVRGEVGGGHHRPARSSNL